MVKFVVFVGCKVAQANQSLFNQVKQRRNNTSNSSLPVLTSIAMEGDPSTQNEISAPIIWLGVKLLAAKQIFGNII